MNKIVNLLLNKFVSKLKPIKKDIYSIFIHGSSFSSNELKPFQDLDLYVALRNNTLSVLKKFKLLIKEFCKENSDKDTHIIYSIAGSGRAPIERVEINKNQVFKLDLFVSSERKARLDFKWNESFYRNFANRGKSIMGEDLGKFSQYSGEQENPVSFYGGFDKLQWTYCSMLEYRYDEKVLSDSCQENVFFLLRRIFIFQGLKIDRKDKLISSFKKLFPKDYYKFKQVFDYTKKLRYGKKIEISASRYLDLVRKFDSFVGGKIL